MDYLWSPWRYQYVSQGAEASGCLFCDQVQVQKQRDQDHYILHRGRLCYALLNLYPYTVGHLMLVPYAHVPDFSTTDPEALAELMALARVAEKALRAEYQPDGLNAGFNIGQCAGAGVAGHLHLHVLPRWFADSNFITVVGETRVLPEDLATTYRKLRPHFAGAAWGER